MNNGLSILRDCICGYAMAVCLEGVKHVCEYVLALGDIQ